MFEERDICTKSNSSFRFYPKSDRDILEVKKLTKKYEDGIFRLLL